MYATLNNFAFIHYYLFVRYKWIYNKKAKHKICLKIFLNYLSMSKKKLIFIFYMFIADLISIRMSSQIKKIVI